MRILFRDVLRVEHIGIGRECQERDHGTHGIHGRVGPQHVYLAEAKAKVGYGPDAHYSSFPGSAWGRPASLPFFVTSAFSYIWLDRPVFLRVLVVDAFHTLRASPSLNNSPFRNRPSPATISASDSPGR